MTQPTPHSGAADWIAKLTRKRVFCGVALLFLVQAIWAAKFSGTALSPKALEVRSDGTVAIERLELALAADMAPLEIKVLMAWRGGGKPQMEYELTDPEGKRLTKGKNHPSAPSNGAKAAAVWSGDERLAWLEQLKAGTYHLRLRAAPDKGQKLVSAEVRLRRNASKSHFFRNLTVTVLVFLALRRWRQRQDSEPAAPLPGVANLMPAPPLPMVERVTRRCVLEGLALLISFVRVPLVGYYAMLVLLGFFFGFGPADSERAQSITAAFKGEAVQQALHSEWGNKVIEWVVPEGSYQGMSALWVLGVSAGTIVGAVHLVTLPFRLFLRRRPPPTFRQRAQRVFYLHVAALVLVAAWGWGQDNPVNSEYEELMIVFGMFALIGYVPALILSTITGAIENAIERLEPPPPGRRREAPAPAPTRP